MTTSCWKALAALFIFSLPLHVGVHCALGSLAAPWEVGNRPLGCYAADVPEAWHPHDSTHPQSPIAPSSATDIQSLLTTAAVQYQLLHKDRHAEARAKPLARRGRSPPLDGVEGSGQRKRTVPVNAPSASSACRRCIQAPRRNNKACGPRMRQMGCCSRTVETTAGPRVPAATGPGISRGWMAGIDVDLELKRPLDDGNSSAIALDDSARCRGHP